MEYIILLNETSPPIGEYKKWLIYLPNERHCTSCNIVRTMSLIARTVVLTEVALKSL